MTIHFSPKILKIIFNEKQMIRKYGAEIEKSTRVAISVLRNVKSLKEVPNVPPTRRHRLQGKMHYLWALDLNKSYRLLIQPSIDSDDLSKITEVTVCDIVDYH